MPDDLPIRPDVAMFYAAQRERHPELARTVTYRTFRRIAEREGLIVQVVRLSHPARFVRVGAHVGIQLHPELGDTARARFGMHELCHYWRDDIGEDACYHAADEWVPNEAEDFAELFAWLCTHPGPLPGLRD